MSVGLSCSIKTKPVNVTLDDTQNTHLLLKYLCDVIILNLTAVYVRSTSTRTSVT